MFNKSNGSKNPKGNEEVKNEIHSVLKKLDKDLFQLNQRTRIEKQSQRPKTLKIKTSAKIK
jgi:hypothetical protein